MDQTAQNLQQQIELYGEPLGETVRRVVGPLGLTQGGLAQLIGLSAPMLSQLVSAQRVKIGNPSVVSRLRAASELADLAIASEINPADIPAALDGIRETTGALTTSGPTSQTPRGAGGSAGTPYATPPGLTGQVSSGTGLAPGAHPGWATGGAVRADDGAGAGTGTGTGARVVVRAIQDLLREVASAEEIQRAAAIVEPESPGLADLLLTYGTGRTADALAHYEQHHG